MTDAPLSIGMMPSHPGAIVREEILAPLGLNVTKAAKALGVRRATLSDLLNEKAALSPSRAVFIFLIGTGVRQKTATFSNAGYPGSP